MRLKVGLDGGGSPFYRGGSCQPDYSPLIDNIYSIPSYVTTRCLLLRVPNSLIPEKCTVMFVMYACMFVMYVYNRGTQ